MTLFRCLPRSLWLSMGRGLGLGFYFLDSCHRRLALRNLATAFGPDLSLKQRRRTARRSFAHFGGALADFFYLGSFPAEKRNSYIRLKGKHHLMSALAQKKGVLIFSAHFGLWEMATSLISRFAPLWVIARPMDHPLLERKVTRLRRSLGARVIPKHDAGRKVLRVLRNRETAAVLIDQNVLREESVFVDFFGKPASTTPALAAFHLRTGAPVLPVFCRLARQKTWLVDIRPPVAVEKTGHYRHDLMTLTQTCTRIIEETIRRHPEQWLWFHDRWRSRPE